MAFDPVDALSEGFVDPLAPERFMPRLLGAEGRHLMQWLQEGGVNAGLLRDVHVAFRLQGEPYQAAQNLAGLQQSLRGVIYARGFHAYPTLASFLHAAVFQVTDWAQWEGLLNYLQGLAQEMLQAGMRDRA